MSALWLGQNVNVSGNNFDLNGANVYMEAKPAMGAADTRKTLKETLAAMVSQESVDAAIASGAATAVQTELARASAQEGILNTAITAEMTRATGVEGVITTAITTAVSAEAVLRTTRENVFNGQFAAKNGSFSILQAQIVDLQNQVIYLYNRLYQQTPNAVVSSCITGLDATAFNDGASVGPLPSISVPLPGGTLGPSRLYTGNAPIDF